MSEICRILCVVGIALLCSCLPGTAQAPIDLASEQHATNKVEQNFAAINAQLRTAFDENRFSGAIAGLVDDDGNTWIETYGIKNAEGSQDISAQSTVFLTASVTKTMTSLSVLKLLEEGVITSLDAPANKYLTRVQLPDWKGQDVTIRHLLTHTSGLRTLGFGIIRRHQVEAPVSASFVRKHTGGLVREPGEAIVYSNLGMAILGTLVEDVTGDTLHTYMTREVFAPLEMDTARLNYEVYPSGDFAKSYIVGDGDAAEIPFDANTPFLAPAGSAMLSAHDFAKYAAFWLSQGRDPSTKVISEDTFSKMVTPQLSNHSGGQEIGLGVFIHERAGKRIWSHNGAFGGYTSIFMVSPETGLAGFIVVAGRPNFGTGSPYLAYAEGANLLARVVSGEDAPTFEPQPIPNASTYSGTYVHDRRFTRGIPRFLGLLSPTVVIADEQGFLTIGSASRLGLVADGVIGEAGDGSAMPRTYGLPTAERPYFKMNADRMRRAGFFETPQNLVIILGAGLVLSVLGFIRFFGPATGQSTPLRISKWSPAISVLCTGGIFAALLLFYSPGEGIGTHLVAGETLRTSLISIFAWAVLLCSVYRIAGFAMSFFAGVGRIHWGWRILDTIAVLGLVFLSLFVIVTGLADPRLV